MNKRNKRYVIWKIYFGVALSMLVFLIIKIPCALQAWKLQEQQINKIEEENVTEFLQVDKQNEIENVNMQNEKNEDVEKSYQEEISRLNVENEELRAKIIEEKKKLTDLQHYSDVAKELGEKYQRISEYEVVGYEQQYDSSANDKIQQMNKLNYAVGELSKRTPWGILVNGLASMAIDGNDAYFDRITYMNRIMANGIQDVTVSAKSSLEQLNTRIKILKDLTQEEKSIREQFQNQAYLQYIFDGDNLGLEEYAVDSEKKLYIIQQELWYTHLLYNVLFMDSADKTSYLRGIEEQNNEISDIFNELDIDASQLVSTEELAEYIVPIMQAGMQAIVALEEDGNYVPGADSRFVNMWDGEWNTQVWYKGRFINDNTAFCTHIITKQRSSLDKQYDLYYASGVPFYINGFYFLNGRILNDDGIVNDKELLDCAEWMKTNMGLVDSYEEEAFAERFLNALNGWG